MKRLVHKLRFSWAYSQFQKIYHNFRNIPYSRFRSRTTPSLFLFPRDFHGKIGVGTSHSKCRPLHTSNHYCKLRRSARSHIQIWISRRTRAVSVGELYACNEQWHQQIDRPPRINGIQCHWARSKVHVCAVAAVVRVVGRKTVRGHYVCVRTELVRRTIECHVHIQSTIYRHCKHRIIGDHCAQW